MPAARDSTLGGAPERATEPPGTATVPTSALGLVAALWGIAGVVALLGYAAWRLGGHALEMLSLPLGPAHWTALVAWVAFMAWSEGYRGFQQAFSPRTAARARHLAERPQALRVVLAPAFCMGFFHATRRRLLTTYALTGTIVGFVALARLLDQPWRGIVDAGVVAGLAWGILSLLWSAWAAFDDPASTVPPEVPGE